MITTFFDAGLLLIVAFYLFICIRILGLGHGIYIFYICIRILELFLTFQIFTTLLTVCTVLISL